jgi:hypothetical protein
VVVPCSLVVVYRRFRGACCFHHQGDLTGLHYLISVIIVRKCIYDPLVPLTFRFDFLSKC